MSSITTPADRRKNTRFRATTQRRLRAALPYLAIGLVLAAYVIFWLTTREILKARLAHEADGLRRAGYLVDVQGPRVGGFPFRLRLHYDRLRVLGPSGWGLSTSGLDAQAFVYAPHHWVIVATHGLDIERGGDGPLEIRGKPLRASIAAGKPAPWRIVVEGENLEFTAPGQAHPFTFSRAARFDAMLRPAPDGSGGQLLMRLTGAAVAPSSALAPIAGAHPLALDMALRLTKPEAFKGVAWASAVKAWSRARGEAQVVRFKVDAGPANLSVADGGAFRVGPDGRLAGEARLHVALPSTVAVLPMVFGGRVSLPIRIVALAAALVRGAHGDLVALLTFENGRTVLDGFPLARAPQVYRPEGAEIRTLRTQPGETPVP